MVTFLDKLFGMIPTIGNRIMNRHTPKGVLLFAVLVGMDNGLDIEALSEMFDGVEGNPAEMIFYVGLYLVVHYVGKE